MYGDFDSRDSMNGGPYHRGTCPNCGRPNGTTYDGLCDRCETEEATCPICGGTAALGDLERHGKCTLCIEEAATIFTKKFKTRLEAEEIINLI